MKDRKSILTLILIIFTVSMAYPATVEFPLLQSMSYYPYWQNDILAKGKFEGTLQFHYSNVYTFNHLRTIFNDFESFSTLMGVRYGLFNNGTVELYVRHTAIFGGILDHFIEDFHSTFNLPDADRPLYPRNQVRYDYKDSFSYHEGESGISPITLSFLTRFYRSGNFTLKGRIAVGIPVSSKPGFSSDKVSLTCGLVLSYEKKKFRAEFANHATFISQPSWLENEEMRSVMIHSKLELELFRVITGFVFRNSVFKKDDVSHNAVQVYVGYRILRNLDFIFQEDFTPFDTTPDIGFNLRYRFDF